MTDATCTLPSIQVQLLHDLCPAGFCSIPPGNSTWYTKHQPPLVCLTAAEATHPTLPCSSTKTATSSTYPTWTTTWTCEWGQCAGGSVAAVWLLCGCCGCLWVLRHLPGVTHMLALPHYRVTGHAAGCRPQGMRVLGAGAAPDFCQLLMSCRLVVPPAAAGPLAGACSSQGSSSWVPRSQPWPTL